MEGTGGGRAVFGITAVKKINKDLQRMVVDAAGGDWGLGNHEIPEMTRKGKSGRVAQDRIRVNRGSRGERGSRRMNKR